jgi:hypothetical protein
VDSDAPVPVQALGPPKLKKVQAGWGVH